MSPTAFALSPDLQRLRAEGYAIRLHVSTVGAVYLVVDDVSYVTPAAVVARGVLATQIDLSTGQAGPPLDHTMHLAGERPSDRRGVELPALIAGYGDSLGAVDLPVNFYLSNKPADQQPFPDFYAKVTHYVRILEAHAQAVNSDATSRTFPAYADDDGDGPFVYFDTATSRAGTEALTRRLALPRVAIVGLGGSGSYVLDLLAKTPIGELHLFDGDDFLSHNAFRAPGAASLDDLQARPKKVAYYTAKYGVLKRSIVPHAYALTDDNADELKDMDFVFLCMDGGRTKQRIVEALERHERPFIDVGMGLHMTDDGIMGSLQTTLSTAQQRQHLRARVSMADAAEDDLYNHNVQVVELNALNATLAVIRYKKRLGFYRDEAQEHFSAYRIDTNSLINEDEPATMEEAS